MKLTSWHIIKIGQETFFLAICSKVVLTIETKGENMIFLFYTELHILVKTIELQNLSFFLNISLDAWMAMAGAVLALVW